MDSIQQSLFVEPGKMVYLPEPAGRKAMEKGGRRGRKVPAANEPRPSENSGRQETRPSEQNFRYYCRSTHSCVQNIHSLPPGAEAAAEGEGDAGWASSRAWKHFGSDNCASCFFAAAALGVRDDDFALPVSESSAAAA